jgi:serine/threonine-protein kinase
VLPFADGGSLRDALMAGRHSTIGEILLLVRQLASALQYAHRHSVVHRDIKPGNILFKRGRPMLTDFGVAIAVGAASERRLTKSGYSPGTPAYMSPEQARGERDIDARADQYSLACVVLEMLTGEPPFTGTPQAVMSCHAKEQPPSVRILRPDVPQSFEHVLERALAKHREARFESIDSFARALLGSIRQPGGSAVSMPLSRSRRLCRSTPLGRSASLGGHWVPRWLQRLLHPSAA